MSATAIRTARSARRPSWARRAAAALLRRPSRRSALPLVGAVAGLLVAAVGLFRPAPRAVTEVPSGYAALVNQKGVLMSDFISEVESRYTKSFDQATPAERAAVLHDMINEELLVQRAVLLDFPETTIEVRETMAQGVEAQAAQQFWINPPTDEQLRAFYEKTRADYTTDGTMIMHDLVMHIGGFENANQSTPQAMADAAEAVYQLRSGASMDYVKEHFGFEVGALDGTEEFDFSAKIKLKDALYEEAAKLGSGQVSDPILQPDGIHVLVMDMRRPPTIASFDSVRDKVYMAYQRAQGDQATADTLKILRSQAQILIAPGFSE
ncbi:MAG TPA: peptidylprolyl isomerase [Gammaproteobacteria bacterium]|nr:peptidylprolyl isomerase [Gammaproteobacteria bacterium]